jgi:hypothetical protein
LKRSTGWFKAIAWNILGKWWLRAAMCKAPRFYRLTCFVDFTSLLGNLVDFIDAYISVTLGGDA